MVDSISQDTLYWPEHTLRTVKAALADHISVVSVQTPRVTKGAQENGQGSYQTIQHPVF